MNRKEKEHVEFILSRMDNWNKLQDSDYTISPLSGGLTNENFLITGQKGKYVLRLGGKHTAELGIDRERELQAAKLASLAGINVPLIDFLLPHGHMLTQWVDGLLLSREEFDAPPVITRTAALLTQVHSIESSIGIFDPYMEIYDRIESVKLYEGELPVNLNQFLSAMESIREKRKSGPLCEPVLCHNDPFHNNFMICPHRLLLLDWEFAGRGDAFFDVASVTHMLSQENRDLFIKEYLKDRGSESHDFVLVKEHVEMLRFVMCFWTFLWALIQSHHDKIDHDFSQMAKEICKKMEDYID